MFAAYAVQNLQFLKENIHYDELVNVIFVIEYGD